MQRRGPGIRGRGSGESRGEQSPWGRVRGQVQGAVCLSSVVSWNAEGLTTYN